MIGWLLYLALVMIAAASLAQVIRFERRESRRRAEYRTRLIYRDARRPVDHAWAKYLAKAQRQSDEVRMLDLEDILGAAS